MSPNSCTIQEAAQRTGITVHTLRYYERIGLLPPVTRAANGHRRYTGRDLGWIHLLTLLRDTGMPLQQMMAFVKLEQQGAAALPEQCALLEQHHQALRERIETLQRHLGTLEGKLNYYRGLKQQVPKPHPAEAVPRPNGRAASRRQPKR